VYTLKGNVELTKREKDVYNYVVAFRKEKHFSPSLRKIAAGIGLHSVSTVAAHVHKIADKGWFLPYDGTPYSIVPVTNTKV
jgi:SOS-response transcriptional repressor LexA